MRFQRLSNPWSRLALGVGIYAIGLALRLGLHPVLGNQFGFLFFFPTIGLAAWFAGRAVAWLVTLLAAASVWYFFTPAHSTDLAVLLNTVAFVVVALLIAHAIASGRTTMDALDDANMREADLRMQFEAANEALQNQVADLAQLHELSWKVQSMSGLQSTLDEVLRGAMGVNRADQGLLGLVVAGRDGVAVVASHGFSDEFVRRLEFVPAGAGACGACYLTHERVIVEDVRDDPRFSAYRSVAEAEGFQAVLSTPLVSRGGTLVGVLSVHFPEPHRPGEREMQLMDLYARTAADMIENVQLSEELRRELEVRRATAEELRVTNERFELATHAETLTLFEQDDDLRYCWLHPQRPEFAGAIGRTDEELLSEEAAQPMGILKRDVLRTGGSRRAVVQADLPGGTRYYDLTVSAKRRPDGTIVGISGAALDITERKQTEMALIRAKDELARINAELEQRVAQRTASITELLAQMEAFSYSVSHDLRAPLRAIGAFASALKDDHSGALSNDGIELVGRIVRGTERMNRLIGDVLAYTRVQRQELPLKAVSLTQCFCDVLQQNPELQTPSSVITWAGQLPVVMGNEAFIGQVLSNLLNNAVKFVPPGRVPHVVITSEVRGDFVRVCVEDNGIGIAPGLQSRLFGMFERLTADRRYEGTGVGLAIVKRAVQRMGGTVGVESDGIVGSRFWFELPIVPDAEVTSGTASPFAIDDSATRETSRA